MSFFFDYNFLSFCVTGNPFGKWFPENTIKNIISVPLISHGLRAHISARIIICTIFFNQMHKIFKFGCLFIFSYKLVFFHISIYLIIFLLPEFINFTKRDILFENFCLPSIFRSNFPVSAPDATPPFLRVLLTIALMHNSPRPFAPWHHRPN